MESILLQLKSHGYRLTQPRQCVLEALTTYPQSVVDIVNSLKKKHVKVDIATVYRTLEVLVDLGVVGKMQFLNKTVMYELLTGHSHHHHLVCTDCGLIEDIPLDETILIHQVDLKSKFKVQSHTLEFFGLCTDCQ